MEKQVSIYEQILKQREEHPTLPYLFQDVETAGREDTLFTLLTEGLPYSQKEDLASTCCESIREAIDTSDSTILEKLLNDQPLRMFFIELRERLRVLIETDQFTQQELHNLGMKLTRNSPHHEIVKLGIILLGFYPHDLTLKIFKVLGYHSEFTIYVAESIHHAHFRQNDILFDLVKNTTGYGRLAALFLLKPVTNEQQQWVLKYAIKSNQLSSIYVNIALQKTDIRKYLFSAEIDQSNYHDFMYIVAYQELMEMKSLSNQALALMEKLVEKRDLASTFIDEAGLVTIWLKIIDSWKQDYQYVDNRVKESQQLDNYWNIRFERYEKMIRAIEVFLNKPKWHHLVIKELLAPNETDYLIVNTLQFLEMKPDFQAFSALMKRNPLGLNLLDFFLIHYPETYFQDASDYLFNLLSEQLFELPLLFVEDTETDSSDLIKVNMWLETLMKNMLEKEFFDIEWCIKLLAYYQPKLRRLAMLVLRKYIDEWEDDDTVLTALETLSEIEENRKNNRLLYKLLDMDEIPTKVKKYLTVRNPVMTELPTDTKLLETKIAGIRYQDLSVEEELVEKGKILQLIREKDNEFDSNAIAVTLEDGCMLGYIPRSENRVLATLMDNDEILFARFESEDIDDDQAQIAVLLRKKSGPAIPDKPSGGNIVPFPTNK